FVSDVSDGNSCPELITRTYSVTDDCGNSINVTQTITVHDITDPVVATAPVDVTVECMADVPAMIDLAWTDNCDGSGTVSGTDVSDGGGCPLTITRTWTYTDLCGNAASVSQLITVNDITPPTASNPAAVSVECTGDIPPANPGVVTDVADNCGAPIVLWEGDVSDGNSCPETITRTYSVTDDCGNSIYVTQTITVNDITEPTVACQNITVQLDATGHASITVADIDNGSSDNCGIDDMWLDVSSFDCEDVGPNVVNLFVQDLCGTIYSCAATVTVEDNIPPVITCPGDETVNAAAGSCSVVVSGIAPVFASDNCSNALVTYRMEGATTGLGVADASGTAFNKGVTTVWYKITDPYNNADSCAFDVTVLTTIVPPDSAFSSVDEVCPGDGDIILYYEGGVMVEGGTAVWYDAAALTNVIGTGNVLTVPAPVVATTYFVRFEGTCDISPALSTTVTVKALTVDPVAAFVDRTPVCPGDGLISLSYIGGDPGSNGSAVWYEDAGFTSSVGSGNNLSIAVPMSTTTYYMRYEADCDTSAAVSVEVSVWPLPEPVFVEKTEHVCVNGLQYRYVAGGLAGSLFNWSITNGTIVSQDNDTVYVDWGDEKLTGTLELTEISVHGCVSDPLLLQVVVDAPDLDLGEDAGLCVGESVTIDPEGDFVSYLWHDGSTGSDFTTEQEGWVIVDVTDAFGCKARDSTFVTEHELPVVDLGPDTVVCGDRGLVLDAGTDGIYYQWSTGDISQEITVFMGDNNEYWVEVENEFGCLGGDTILVRNCSMNFYFRDIPTAITPGDGNGLNDFWKIDKLATFSQAVVEIFDRWGTLVWRSEPGYSTPWDGRTMRGSEVPMDSYHFVIELNTEAEKDYITGIITVIR
ncbi:MAG: gliding motility-associated C-terminal domain-containing protein, partial [Bacteroidales bacterium]|nr:gliding motility-associated C-terminal domain-containing protein [Bacteroidales bacterium]